MNTTTVCCYVILCVSISAAVATAQEPKTGAPVVHHYFLKTEHDHEAEWGYSGKTGPENWGRLSPKYRLASEGKHQSPIDINSKRATERNLPRLRFAYKAVERIAILNNGHTIQHNETPGSYLHVGNRSYALEQFHLHVPSEHTIDGHHSDMEIHLVHKSESGEVAVVAVMVNQGVQNPVVTPFFKQLPKHVNEVAELRDFTARPADCLPTDLTYFTYAGSFTTPPCTEDVRWIVMRSPIQIRPDALANFKKAIGGNNRPVQPVNRREVERSASPNATRR